MDDHRAIKIARIRKHVEEMGARMLPDMIEMQKAVHEEMPALFAEIDRLDAQSYRFYLRIKELEKQLASREKRAVL